MKFSHYGVPTTASFAGEIDIAHLKMTVSDHSNNAYGIQKMRFWEGAPYPDIVITQPHIAFEVDDLAQALIGKKVIIEPNSSSHGLTVAFIEIEGVAVELMEYVKS